MENYSLNLDDSLLGNTDFPVKLPVFEGPLDLLLFLIRKNEIDIYDIPIVQITNQYMSIIRSMEKLDLDVAGEFFVMAATLMYIKSRMLLPTDEALVQSEDEPQDVDPRWELVEQLLEYKKVKQGALLIEDLIKARQEYLLRQCHEKDLSENERPLKNSDQIEIWNTFNLVLRRLAEKLVEGEIVDEQVTVTDRMEYILALGKKEFTFSSLFQEGQKGYMFLVSTLIAVLELTRLHKMQISQTAAFDDISCVLCAEVSEAQSILENADKSL